MKLSRLLVMLALVLFGAPQGHADGTAAQAGPVAQGKVEQAKAIPTVQRHLSRADIPDDDAPDMEVPGACGQTGRLLLATPPAAQRSLLPVAIRILPPLRGPPVV